MASLQRNKAVFLAALVAVSMLLMVVAAQDGSSRYCQPMANCTIKKCRAVCRPMGLTVINCWQEPGQSSPGTCCCFN